MDVNNLIDEIFDLLEDSSSVPLSRKVMVDPDEIYEILNEIREGLPQEIRKSQEIAIQLRGAYFNHLLKV